MLKEITRSLDKFFIVSNLPLFSELSSREKVFVANRGQITEYSRSDILYNQGDPKDALYMVISGKIGLFRTAEREHAHAVTRKGSYIEILRKGDYVGVISLLTGKPHSLSAKAITDTRVFKIEQAEFKEIVDRIPKLSVHFSKMLSRRVHIKETGTKEIFQSVLIAVLCTDDGAYASKYAQDLAQNIRKESGRTVMIACVNKETADPGLDGVVLRNVSAQDASGIDRFINQECVNFHFVIFDIPQTVASAEQSTLRESDLVHIIFDSYDGMLENLTRVMQKVGHNHDGIKILLKEEVSSSFKVDRSQVYATLPRKSEDCHKVMRRIARDTSQVMVGLALGAGGALGLSEIGILSVLEEENIPVDYIAGTSMGALIAGFWAAGFASKEIEKICGTVNTMQGALSLVDITVPKKGLISGKKVREFLGKFLGDKTFYDLKLPLRIVACDIAKREEVIISSGKIVDAIMASIAIPGVFNPVHAKDGKVLVDGGIVIPVPVSVLAREGIKRIIAVNAMPSPDDKVKSGDGILDIIVNSIYSMEYRIGKYACQEADVYMHPVLENAAWYEFYRIKDFIKVGRREAEKALPKIKELVKA